MLNNALLLLAERIKLEPKLAKQLIIKPTSKATKNKFIIKSLGIFRNKATIGKIATKGKVPNNQFEIILTKITNSKI